MFLLRPEAPTDAPAIEALLDEVFGVRRQHKTSYRYRVGIAPLRRLCLVAEKEGRLVGTIRYWPVRLGGEPALLLGPVASARGEAGNGIGRALIETSLDRAARLGHDLVLLVGDPAYYARFGFAPAPPAIRMPGEDPARLQYKRLGVAERPLPTGILRRADADRAGGDCSPDSFALDPGCAGRSAVR